MGYDQNTAAFTGSVGSTSSSLLGQVRERQVEAWGRLVEIYAPLVYRWCRDSGLQAADAADIGQEVFTAVNRTIANFRRDRPGDSFRGWLWTITANKVTDYFRKNKDLGQGGSQAQQWLAAIPAEPPTTSTAAEGEVQNALLRDAMQAVQGRVARHTWEAFWRVTVEDRDPSDTARELGISVSSVYVAIHRIRQMLRTEMEGLMN